MSELAITAIERLLGSVRNSAVGRARNLGSSVFIGHGHSDDWKQVSDWAADKLHLEIAEFNAEAAHSLTIAERLSAMLDQAAAAVMVVTGEREHPDGSLHARENVVHEIGLLQGRLGFRRVAILHDRRVELPSNLHGLTMIEYDKGRFRASVRVQQQLRGFFEREGLLDSASQTERRRGARSRRGIGE